MAEQKQTGYTHDKLIIKCQINSAQSDKTEAAIRNEHKFDKLESNIIQAFPFLQEIDKSQWTICIQSQVIDKNDMDKFKSILATIPPTAIVDVVWKTDRKPVKIRQVKNMSKYLINVHFKDNKFIHKIYEDKDSWGEQIFNDLKSAISQQFNLRVTSFNLYGDEEVSVENIDDVMEAFDEIDSDDSDNSDESHETQSSVNIFVKLKTKNVKDMIHKPAKKVIHKPVKKVIHKPDISVIQNSNKVISLGRRLKLLEECIAYNKYKYELADEKCELEDMKSELDCVLKDLKEIGLVEGHDENSYIMSTLNNISNQISNSNNHLTAAIKEINSIIREVMPFDFKEFFKLFSATQKTAENLRNKVCWVLLGPTGAGKSTSIHFFCGSHFKEGTGGSVFVNEADSSLKGKDIMVGEEITESKTRFIEAVEQDLSQYSDEIKFNRNQPQKVLWVDSPGFEDTAGPEVDMSNGIGTIRALKKAKKVKVIIVFKEAFLDNRFHQVRNIANNMGKAITNLVAELDKNNSPIAGFLTKSQHGMKSAQQIFSQAYDEQDKKEQNSNENAIFKALIYKLGKTDSLYDIKIDLKNPKNNEENRLNIIKSLVQTTGYIESPNEVFTEFISERSLSKLKQQIEQDYNTIQNILDNDKYFENPKYIQYIIDILNNIDKLKDIIKNAGGKFVGSRLAQCMEIFKTKWNSKILKGNNILANLDIKECNIHKLNNKMKEFHNVTNIMAENIKIIKPSKYYKEYKLKDVNCLNDGLHKCFHKIYKIIMNYFQQITCKLKSDSDADTDLDIKSDHEDVKSPLSGDDEDMQIESIYNANYNYDYNDHDDDDSYKMILLSIKKCCLLYKHTQQYKNDIYIETKNTELEEEVEKVIKYLNNKLKQFMNSEKSQHVDGVDTLMFMFSNLSKVHNISMIILNNKIQIEDIIKNLSQQTSVDDEKQNNLQNNMNTKTLDNLVSELKSSIDKNIKHICISYSLMPMKDGGNNINVQENYHADFNALLKSKVIKTDDEIRSREDKLVSFCLWINKLYDSLCENTNLYELIIFENLRSWLNDKQKKWLNWLCGACSDELEKCNNMLRNKGAQSWTDVEKLLIECESLRKVSYVKNTTSQDYFKTQSEFDFSKTELAKKAKQIIDFDPNDDDKNIDYDEIIQIARQLYDAGCKEESSEMKQIYKKLKQHLNNLETKTETIILSTEMSDDLITIQSTMKELDTLQRFATFMPEIKRDATKCYKILNDQVLDVLHEIESKYNLSKSSIEKQKTLKDKLEIYLNIKNKINKKILNDVIMKCKLETLTELINVKEDKINKLQDENKEIEKTMEEKCGTIMEEQKNFDKLAKTGKRIMIHGDDGDLEEWLNENGLKSLKEIKTNLEELNKKKLKICGKEKEQQENNMNKINELKREIDEIQKCVKIEGILMSLKPDKVVRYRMDNNFLKKSIAELEKLLDNSHTKKLELYDAYNTLTFLNKCKVIKWNLNNKIQEEKKDESTHVLSNKYVNALNKSLLKHLKAYGDILESNLNDLIGNLKVEDVSKCDLNDSNYVNSTQKTIKKLNDCLREFREIYNFDHRIKTQMEDSYNDEVSKKARIKQLKLVTMLFTANHDNNYINNIMSMHKQEILFKLNQWNVHTPEKLPILRFICLSMSALDRFVSFNKDEHHDDSYYRIAQQIDGKLAEFGKDNTKQIMPLIENKLWSQLTQILNSLKKTAAANKQGVAQKTYRDTVIQLFAALCKLINETKTKLIIEINKDNDIIDDQQIHSLNDGLKSVKNLAETIYPHLYDKTEKNKIEKEENALRLRLSGRLKQLMRAAVQSAKTKKFKQCAKRLDNISRLMDNIDNDNIGNGNISNDSDLDSDNDLDNYNDTDEKDNNINNVLDNDNAYDEKDDISNDNGYEAKDEYDNDSKIVSEYKKMKKQIKAELKNILKQVKTANQSLTNEKIYNPYNRLRLKTLHEQLTKSQNDQFNATWVDIYDKIVDAIRNVLHEIKQRNNVIQMQNHQHIKSMEQSDENSKQLMTYPKQQSYLKTIEMSLSLFPTELKEIIQTMLIDAKECAEENNEIIGDDFKRDLDAARWNDVARNLIEFERNNPKFYQSSRKEVLAKISDVYKSFDNNMGIGVKGFMDNIDKLSSFKSIGLSFTEFKYSDNDNHNNDNKIIISHIESILEKIYKDIESQFENKCKDIKSCLIGHGEYKYLKDGFCIVIKVLKNKDRLPQMFAKRIMKECAGLYQPIQKLINRLKTRKYKGLDKSSGDIDPLIDTLNQLQELNDAEFHSNVQTFLPFMDEKKNADDIKKGIESIDYDLTVKETKDMLVEFKESISKEGLNVNIIQTNQAKRLNYLKDVSMKCKALIKSLTICEEHLDMKQDEFDRTFIKPCTKRMKRDIEKMQRQTLDAFTKERLDVKDLKRANANLEAFYAIRNVFEKDLTNDELCNEIGVVEAIAASLDTATHRVKQLTEEIKQVRNLNDSNKDEYLAKCAEHLMNLEYLNQHMNFKTAVNEPESVNQEENKLHQDIESAIKKSMDFLTTHRQTKSKIHLLYTHLMGTDSNYGAVFTQKHSAFKASLLKAINQKFRELDINSLINYLKQTETEMMQQFDTLIGIDYDRIAEIFKQITNNYDALLIKHLQSSRSFEELKQTGIQIIANDAKNIASQAVDTKTYSLTKLFDSGKTFFTSHFSWFMDKNYDIKNNPRDAYWTSDMRAAVPKLIPHILAVWTLSNASCYYESDDKGALKKARNAQIIAICSILCLDIDSQKKIINNLVEVGTGEGKSVIMAVTAIVLALLDFDVYCACYSELLSKRDQNAFNDLFIQFGVQDNIHYQTFNNVLEQMINDGGEIRMMAKNIVLGDEKVDEKDYKEQEQKQVLFKRRKILFIDEVDKFFSTDFFGKQYTPSCVIPKTEMKNLILFVWNEYMRNRCKWNTITVKKIERSTEYKALLTAFSTDWHVLLKESIKDIIDGIQTFRDDSYKIENGRDICYKYSDTYSSKVFYGYRTLFTYLYELNNGNITDENYVHEKLTWFLKCGSFSYSEIPNDFYAILGVTGTLKSLSKKEHKVIQQSYGIKKYVVMPSLFDKSGKLAYAKNKDIDVIKREYFLNEIHGKIQTYKNNDIESVDRPIIVFFRDENTLNYFYNLDVCETWRAEDRILLLTPDLSESEKRNGILNATKPNCITFATEEYGRGIDFKVFDKKLDTKGMHVQLTYWPDTLAEEIQIKGRTARQGDRGSFHIILNEEEITDQFEVKSEDIQQHKDNGDLYQWLSRIRDKIFEKKYDEASRYVKELRPVHEDSQQLAMSLRTKNIAKAKQKLLLFNKGANIQSAAKLSILIDATGSMGSCLNQCKTVIQKTIPELVKFLKKNNINTDSFEFQIIAYRNYNANADDILQFCSFTSNENELTKFIHSLKASYGWGADEAVEIGFGQLNRQEKKPNIVILMADAPAQNKQKIISKRQRYGEEHWKTARGGIFRNILDWKQELKKFINQNNDASVFCFYLIDYAKKNFDQIARIGKGKSMPLNVNNQTESIKLLQSALSETILFKMRGGNMEYVNKFRQQNKNMPTFL